jgi:hypothetical protein
MGGFNWLRFNPKGYSLKARTFPAKEQESTTANSRGQSLILINKGWMEGSRTATPLIETTYYRNYRKKTSYLLFHLQQDQG